LHSLLNDIENGRDTLRQNTVLVVDEAGMVGSRQMDTLLQKVEQAGSKLVLVGDSRQLQPVDAGGAFRAIAQRLGAAELRDVRRQREAWARQVVHDLADGKAGQALQSLSERGLLRAADSAEQARDGMAADYLAAMRQADRPGNVLMIAGTRRDVAMLNHLVREQRQIAGELGDTLPTGQGNFSVGDRLL